MNDVFQRALVSSVLEGYSDIPEDKTDEGCFSPTFRVWIMKMIRKTQRRSWYYVNTTAKKAILVAVIISLLAITAMAIPTVRKKVVEFFVREHEERFSIIFDTEAVADAPKAIEDVYYPSYIPEGYVLETEVIRSAGIELAWKNSDENRLEFSQSPIPEDTTNDQWIGIDSEGVEQTEICVGEYTVTLFTGTDLRIAVWTDGFYFYTLNMDSDISIETMNQIILSVKPRK